MLDELEPETCLLTWDIRLPSETADADIREVFEFVEDSVHARHRTRWSAFHNRRARHPGPCWRVHRKRRT